jgi:Ni,Fe-hydrogenase maturation factor
LKNALLLGFGNPDRQDDGVAWHILQRVCKALGRVVPQSIEDDFPPFGDEYPHFLFDLQLTPEMSELLAEYPFICFVDAHTGSLPDDFHQEALQAHYQRSPLTHHMTPESVLALTYQIYHKQPQSLLISVLSYSFGFMQGLSPETEALADQAVEQILAWLQI